MIVVKIELWSAITHKVSEIGRMYIANTGEGTDPARGDYTVAVCRRNSDDLPQPLDPNGPKATRTGAVADYPRLSYNVWRLIARAVLSAFPEERTHAAPKTVWIGSKCLIVSRVDPTLDYRPGDNEPCCLCAEDGCVARVTTIRS